MAGEQAWIDEHRRELERRTRDLDLKAAERAQVVADQALQSVADPEMRVLVRLIADLMGRDGTGKTDAQRAEWHVVGIVAMLKAAREGTKA